MMKMPLRAFKKRLHALESLLRLKAINGGRKKDHVGRS